MHGGYSHGRHSYHFRSGSRSRSRGNRRRWPWLRRGGGGSAPTPSPLVSWAQSCLAQSIGSGAARRHSRSGHAAGDHSVPKSAIPTADRGFGRRHHPGPAGGMQP